MPEGKKWRGKSVNRVLEPMKEVSQIHRSLFIMEKTAKLRIKELDRESKLAMKELADELTYVDVNDIYIGGWECEKSIADYCVYDTRKDFHRDHCLFCGEPSDRG